MTAYRSFDELKDRLVARPEGARLLHEERLATVQELLDYESERVAQGEPPDEQRLLHLRECIEALGGHLELAAVFDDRRLPITI